MKGIRKNKEGAASFYIVAFSTLVLVIIATSFAMTVIAEVARTSNDELSQSAYDSAMAGVEDAKLAYANYQRCLSNGATATAPNGDNTLTCNEIVYIMQHPDCNMVGRILGRIGEKASGEVQVGDTVTTASGIVKSETNQAYTCVRINTTLSDYRSTLTSSNQVRIVRGHFEGSVAAKNITSVKFSWYSNRSDVPYVYSNSIVAASSRVAFTSPISSSVAIPPTIELQLVQTAGTFNISDFDIASGTRTDRATAFLVPTSSSTLAATTNEYGVGAWNGSKNTISAASLAATNDHTTTNKPFAVYCAESSTDEFACSVTLNLPTPIGGDRSNDSFMFVVSLPYGQPDTDFAMEFYCADGSTCSTVTSGGSTVASSQANVTDAQVSIDSTGRANDLYRRVETRFDTLDTSFPFPYYAVQVLNGGITINKQMTVTSEYSNAETMRR